jgi:hypothetical protein
MHGAESTWTTNFSSASQEIPHILWNPKVHYHMYKRPPLVPTQSQVHTVHVIPYYFFKVILKLSIYA